MTKEIPLTQGKVAIVDDDDYVELSKFRWHSIKNKNTFYAGRASSRKNGKQVRIYMHREILGFPKNRGADHINGNGLDNRRENLRIVTCRQNLQNLHIEKSSQFPGISWHKLARKWRAEIQIGNKKHYLGLFTSEIEAARAYAKACQDLVESGGVKLDWS